MTDPGSFLLIGFPDVSVTRDLEEFICTTNLFGIVLFSRNFTSRNQLQELCGHLQEIKAKVSPYPLLVAVDYEGGFVTRFDKVVTWIPSAMAQGRGGNPAWTRNLYHRVSLDLAELGINCNLAPNVDVGPLNGKSAIGIRAFDHDPDIVSTYALEAFRGIQDAGVLACAKHFPGLGHVIPDSHHALPSIPEDPAWFQKHAWKPYQTLIQNDIPLIMTAHAHAPTLSTDSHPVPLSPAVIQKTLRSDLNFKGLVVTDDFSMGAAKAYGALDQAAFASLLAGTDAVMLCHNFDTCKQISHTIHKAIQNETLDKELLIQSETRKEHLFKSWDQTARTSTLSADQIHSIIQTIACKSLEPIKCQPTEKTRTAKTILIAPGNWSSNFLEQKLSLTQTFLDQYQNIFGSLDWVALEDIQKQGKLPESVTGADRRLLACKDPAQIPACFESFAGSRPDKEPIDLLICTQYVPKHPVYAICKSVLCCFGFQRDHQEAITNFMRETLLWT